jgi:hypothetical protein
MGIDMTARPAITFIAPGPAAWPRADRDAMTQRSRRPDQAGMAWDVRAGSGLGPRAAARAAPGPARPAAARAAPGPGRPAAARGPGPQAVKGVSPRVTTARGMAAGRRPDRVARALPGSARTAHPDRAGAIPATGAAAPPAYAERHRRASPNITTDRITPPRPEPHDRLNRLIQPPLSRATRSPVRSERWPRPRRATGGGAYAGGSGAPPGPPGQA